MANNPIHDSDNDFAMNETVSSLKNSVYDADRDDDHNLLKSHGISSESDGKYNLTLLNEQYVDMKYYDTDFKGNILRRLKRCKNLAAAGYWSKADRALHDTTISDLNFTGNFDKLQSKFSRKPPIALREPRHEPSAKWRLDAENVK